MSKLLSTYTRAIAGHLESNLKGTQILSWSDIFANATPAKQRSRLAFGVSGRQYTPMSSDADGNYTDLLSCTFELQAELFTAGGKSADHDRHMDDTYAIERTILYGFQPFVEFSPLRPTRGGNIKWNAREGIFSYSSEFAAAIVVGVGKGDRLTPIGDVLEPEIIGLRLINAWGSEPNSIDVSLTYNTNNS